MSGSPKPVFGSILKSCLCRWQSTLFLRECTVSYTHLPGDIRYKDQNNDGKIDDNDRVFLGRWDSPFMSGINLTAKWRDFTLYVMGNLYIGGYGMKDNSYYWVKGDGKYSEVEMCIRDRYYIRYRWKFYVGCS